MPRRAEGVESAGKRFPLNMQTNKSMHDKLRTAASASGRSLVQEVESRLERSFEQDETGRAMTNQFLGGPSTQYLLHAVAAVIHLAEVQTGKSWQTDGVTRGAIA